VLASSTTWSHLHARSPCVFHEFRIAGVRPPEMSIFATTPIQTLKSQPETCTYSGLFAVSRSAQAARLRRCCYSSWVETAGNLIDAERTDVGPLRQEVVRAHGELNITPPATVDPARVDDAPLSCV
jgi:hypothetical protein